MYGYLVWGTYEADLTWSYKCGGGLGTNPFYKISNEPTLIPLKMHNC